MQNQWQTSCLNNAFSFERLKFGSNLTVSLGRGCLVENRLACIFIYYLFLFIIKELSGALGTLSRFLSPFTKDNHYTSNKMGKQTPF